jgi:hypothetical protein
LSRVTKSFVRAARAPDPVFAAKLAIAAVTSGVAVPPGPFAKEHTVVLRSGAAFPYKLLDVRAGDCIDDNGLPMISPASGLPLRLKAEWFTETAAGSATAVTIDNLGNTTVALPTEALIGCDVKVPVGDLIVTVGRAHAVSVQTDYNCATTVGAIDLNGQTGVALTSAAGPVTIKPATQLNIGAADQPAVLGGVLLDLMGQLLDVLVSHQHIGNLGAPTPLAPPMLLQLQQLKASFVTARTIVSDYVNLSKLPG